MQFRHHTLDNGLEIVAEIAPNAYSSAYAFFVRTGARDETRRDHRRQPFPRAHGLQGLRQALGCRGEPRPGRPEPPAPTPITSEEQTVYYATTLPEDQGKIVELLADMMRPSLRQDDFDTEKKVILEEIAKYDDQPPYGAHEKCMAAFFGAASAGQEHLGTSGSVGDLARDQMLAYFEQRYSPRNMVLVAAGNVDFDGLIRQAERTLRPLADVRRPAALPHVEPAACAGR